MHIAYNGAGEALQSCLAGEAQIFFGTEAAEHILAGMRKRADDDFAEFGALLQEAGLALKK